MKKETLIRKLRHNRTRMLTTAKWIGVSVITGWRGGADRFYFCTALNLVTELRILHPQLLLLLPVGAVVIVALYRGTAEREGSRNRSRSVRHPLRRQNSSADGSLIFLSTLITHLCGGSADGRAPLCSSAGSIGNAIGKWFHFTSKDRHIIIMCGMSAAFSALFGTPIAAAVSPWKLSAWESCTTPPCCQAVNSSLIARAIALAFSLEAPAYEILNLPAFFPAPCGKDHSSRPFSAAWSACSSVSCCTRREISARIPAKSLPAGAGGGSLVLLFYLPCRLPRLQRLGTDVIAGCMEGNVAPEAFLLKMVFTAVTLAAGYKGGEIVPTLFVGASFGCLVGGWLDLSPPSARQLAWGPSSAV